MAVEKESISIVFLSVSCHEQFKFVPENKNGESTLYIYWCSRSLTPFGLGYLTYLRVSHIYEKFDISLYIVGMRLINNWKDAQRQ